MSRSLHGGGDATDEKKRAWDPPDLGAGQGGADQVGALQGQLPTLRSTSRALLTSCRVLVYVSLKNLDVTEGGGQMGGEGWWVYIPARASQLLPFQL